MCTIVVQDEFGPRLENGPCRNAFGACPSADIPNKIRNAGLRPTRQRVELGRLLYGQGDRHVTAEALHNEAVQAGIDVSLATVYNTLNQFTNGGLLRHVTVDGSRLYFDTNVSNHHHYFVEGESEPRDIEHAKIDLAALPEPPDGMEIVRVDIVVRLRPLKRREMNNAQATPDNDMNDHD